MLNLYQLFYFMNEETRQRERFSNMPGITVCSLVEFGDKSIEMWYRFSQEMMARWLTCMKTWRNGQSFVEYYSCLKAAQRRSRNALRYIVFSPVFTQEIFTQPSVT